MLFVTALWAVSASLFASNLSPTNDVMTASLVAIGALFAWRVRRVVHPAKFTLEVSVATLIASLLTTVWLLTGLAESIAGEAIRMGRPAPWIDHLFAVSFGVHLVSGVALGYGSVSTLRSGGWPQRWPAVLLGSLGLLGIGVTIRAMALLAD